ncbi:SdpI family protein [Rhodococcus spelaei]|uniref:SdpI family protein n=1 Tax=Rhodococcus spelaei TaxID=2546320 RepID=A0A541BQV7_9NOCA|nr:SdpI family protein [Rhodococcus spelaei]TQF74658.1 SdpI family protein [Rhodococcus spelaei]
MVIVASVLFVLAIVVGSVAVAGLTGRLPRNRWAGVRTPETLASEETFALANRIAGPTMAAAALLLVIGGIGALTLGTVGGFGVAAVAVVAALVTAAYGGTVGARAAAAAAPAGCGDACGCGSAPSPDASEASATISAITTESRADAAAAADCGEDSCGSCSLKGACLPH